MRLTLLERIFSPRWVWPFAAFTVRSYLRLVHGLRVDGLENVPREGGAVIACNHISAWDPPAVGVSTRRRLHFMAKRELFEKPFMAALLRGLHAFPVDRERQDIGAVKEALRRLREGKLVGIFVQGTRNAGDAAALDGAAFLAQRAGVPLLPAAIWREGRAFHISFGEALTAEGSSRDDATALTGRLMLRIRELAPAGALAA